MFDKPKTLLELRKERRKKLLEMPLDERRTERRKARERQLQYKEWDREFREETLEEVKDKIECVEMDWGPEQVYAITRALLDGPKYTQEIVDITGLPFADVFQIMQLLSGETPMWQTAYERVGYPSFAATHSGRWRLMTTGGL